jgi:hypothetical protein
LIAEVEMKVGGGGGGGMVIMDIIIIRSTRINLIKINKLTKWMILKIDWRPLND